MVSRLVFLRSAGAKMDSVEGFHRAELENAAWYGSVHDVGVRYVPESEEAR